MTPQEILTAVQDAITAGYRFEGDAIIAPSGERVWFCSSGTSLLHRLMAMLVIWEGVKE